MKLCSTVRRGSTRAQLNSAALHHVMLHYQTIHGVRSDASLNLYLGVFYFCCVFILCVKRITISLLVWNHHCSATSVWPGFVLQMLFPHICFYSFPALTDDINGSL